MRDDIVTSFELALGDYGIGMQFIFRQRRTYGGMVIELLPTLSINWSNGKCIFGIEAGWLNFTGAGYIRRIPKERKAISCFTISH